MPLGILGTLGGTDECDHCSPPGTTIGPCHISCDDGSFAACFEGKCIKVTVSGWSNGPHDPPCTDCGSTNGVHLGQVGFYGPCVIEANADDGEVCGQSQVYISFPSTVERLIYVSTEPFCDCDDALSIDYANYRSTATEGDTDAWANLQSLIDTLCAGGAVTIPFTDYGNGGYCSYDGSDVTLQLVDGSECGNSAVTSYNCDSGTCTIVEGDTGTYSTLSACVNNGCAAPSASYDCIQGVCTDPHDGSGAWLSLADCEAATACAAPSCIDLDDVGCAAMTLVAEIHSLNFCTDGTYDWPLDNLNGPYELSFVPATGYIFHIDLGTEGDYGDPGILYRQLIVVGGVHEELYIWAIEMTVTCTDGVATIVEIDFLTHGFSWTEPDAPVAFGVSDFGYNPTETLGGTVRGCSVSDMLSIFHFTDCLSASTTFYVDGIISI